MSYLPPTENKGRSLNHARSVEFLGRRNASDLKTTTPMAERKKSLESCKMVEIGSQACYSLRLLLTLTEDVLVEIFLKLPWLSVSVASRVCQDWWHASTSDKLGWTVFGRTKFTQLPPMANLSQVNSIKYDALRPWRDASRAGRGGNRKGCYVAYVVPEGQELKLHAAHTKDYSKACLALESGNGLPDTDTLNDKDLYHVQIQSPDTMTLTVTLAVNLRRFENYLLHGIEFQARRVVIDGVTKQLMDEVLQRCSALDSQSKKPHVTRPDFSRPQPFGFVSSLQLHKYQLDAVSWMRAQELTPRTPLTYSSLIPWKKGRSRYLFDFTPNKERAYPVESLANHCFDVTIKGSVLADEMGLGKTVEMLALILSNPFEGDLEIITEGVDSYYTTGATLILCPNHLVAQWVSEVNKYTSPPLKVVTLSIKAEHVNTTDKDIQEADIVIVSYSFLKNPNYFLTSKLIAPEPLNSKVRSEWKKRKHNNPELSKKSILNHFSWHRIVLDEGHEALNQSFYTNYLASLKTTHKWYITGTPFPSLSVLVGISIFFHSESTDPEFPNLNTRRSNLNDQSLMDSYVGWVFGDLILNHYYWRQTKESVKEEYQLPGLMEQLVLVQFSEIEKELYEEESNNEAKLQICCHPQAKSETVGDGLDDLATLSSDRHRALLNQETGLILKIDKYTATYKEENKLVDRRIGELKEAELIGDEKDIKKLKQALEKHKDKEAQAKDLIKNAKMKLKEIKQQIEKWRILTENVKKETEAAQQETEKSAKMDIESAGNEIPPVTPPVTPPKPSLRRSSSVLAQMAYVEKQRNLRAKKLVLRYGTKLSHMIIHLEDLLAKDPKHRVIIFSQYPPFLNCFASILKSSGIKTTFVEGNIQKKNKALNAFKSEDSDIRVIMFSLLKAASGTNITEATHILLLDPMKGTKEEAQAVESQAIGRAYRQGQEKKVTIIRFIVKDTIEHELYLRNNPNQEGFLLGTPGKKQLVKSNSVVTLLANSPGLQKTNSFLALMEKEDNKESNENTTSEPVAL